MYYEFKYDEPDCSFPYWLGYNSHKIDVEFLKNFNKNEVQEFLEGLCAQLNVDLKITSISESNVVPMFSEF